VPELPEVEVLVRHLRPLVVGKRVRAVKVLRERVIRPTSVKALELALAGATFTRLERRGKYLLFELKRREETIKLLGHLGMTGRMYLVPKSARLPKHVPILLDLGREQFVFEDTRYFGRFTLDLSCVENLGPEPLSDGFTPQAFYAALRRSKQPVKVKLLDQRLVAGVGNIYASEALWRARIAPRMPSHRITKAQAKALQQAIRDVLNRAIKFGSTVPLNYAEGKKGEKLFYFGQSADASGFYQERLQVYDRVRKPCPRCGTPIKRITQAGRSTFFCAKCVSR